MNRRSLVVDPDALRGPLSQPLMREREIEGLAACYAGDLAYESPIHVWIHGPTGAGKTFCVKHVINTKTNESGTLAIFVSCREKLTLSAVLDNILDIVRPIRSQAKARDRQLAILAADLSDRRCVIALDDIDVLSRQDTANLLYHLCRLPRTSLVCISPSRVPLLNLPEPVRSRLCPRQIRFPRYSPDEIQAILESTAKRALDVSRWEQEVLSRITAESRGDARRALALLRHVVQRAEESGASTLTPEHLVPSNFSHFNPHHDEALSLLGIHHSLLHEIISVTQPVTSGEVERRYVAACERRALKAAASRTVTKYLAELTDRKLLQRERGPGTSGWIYRLQR